MGTAARRGGKKLAVRTMTHSQKAPEDVTDCNWKEPAGRTDRNDPSLELTIPNWFLSKSPLSFLFCAARVFEASLFFLSIACGGCEKRNVKHNRNPVLFPGMNQNTPSASF